MKMQNRNRATLMAVAGGYVVYLAYEILRDGLAGKSTMPMWLCILATALLGLAGIAVLILAWKIFRTKDKEEDSPADDPDALK